jgi:hypothetical protein
MSPIFDNGLLEELQENLRVISGIGYRVFRSANKSEGHCFLQHVLEFLNSIHGSSWYLIKNRKDKSMGKS